MQEDKTFKVGIGFATGRKSFKKVSRTYIHTWKESGLVEDECISLNIFVAYDLLYNKTAITDYTNIHPELVEQVDGCNFIGSNAIKKKLTI